MRKAPRSPTASTSTSWSPPAARARPSSSAAWFACGSRDTRVLPSRMHGPRGQRGVFTRARRGAHRALGSSALIFLALARPPAARAELPPAIAQQIAIAEDERRWSDGELHRLLADARPEVRARAALAVGRLQDSTSVPALLPLLDDASLAVRHGA